VGADTTRPAGKRPSELTWQRSAPVHRPPPDRECEQCSELLIRHHGESVGNWSVRRFCDTRCARAARVKHTAERQCEQCSVALRRGAGEWTRRYLQRRYCSPGCANAARRVHYDNPREVQRLRMRAYRERKKEAAAQRALVFIQARPASATDGTER
jgi:hypothetical protein